MKVQTKEERRALAALLHVCRGAGEDEVDELAIVIEGRTLREWLRLAEI